jgi:hypothetical protein
MRCARAISRASDVLVFYPADLQFKPGHSRLVAPILAGESGIVTGFKEGHYEAFVSSVYTV